MINLIYFYLCLFYLKLFNFKILNFDIFKKDKNDQFSDISFYSSYSFKNYLTGKFTLNKVEANLIHCEFDEIAKQRINNMVWYIINKETKQIPLYMLSQIHEFVFNHLAYCEYKKFKENFK